MSRKVSFKEIICGDYSSQHIAQLIRSAMQRSEQKALACDGYDKLLDHTFSELSRNGHTCECCGRGFSRHANGKGGAGKRSLSLHRVIASRGYVASNIKVICMTCNLGIGEVNTYNDVLLRVRALRWQAKLLNREAKKMLDSGIFPE